MITEIDELIGEQVKVTKGDDSFDVTILDVEEDGPGYNVYIDAQDENVNGFFYVKKKSMHDFMVEGSSVEYDNFIYSLIPEESEEEPKEIEEEIEKTPFNNADLFIEKYKDTLLGKIISFPKDGEKLSITDVFSTEDNAMNLDLSNGGQVLVYPEEFELFLAGGVVNTNNEEEKFNLIIQEEEPVVEESIIEESATQEPVIEEPATEEPVIEEVIIEEIIPEKLNKPEFKYYLTDDNNKIFSGFEYKEDAKSEIRSLKLKGKEFIVKSLRELIGMGIDVNDDSSWKSESVDVDLLFNALQDSRNAQLTMYKADFDTKESLDEAFEAKRYTSLKDMLKKLIREYSDMFSLWSDSKEEKNYLKAKKYLIPLIKQSDIIGDLKK